MELATPLEHHDAFLYGAGDALLGQIVTLGDGKTYTEDQLRKRGREVRAQFMKGLPAFKLLMDALKARVETVKGISAIDGRFLPTRSDHSALNLLLQSCGAIIMKVALVRLDKRLQECGYVPGLHYEFVANVHDEWQIEADEGIGHEVGKEAVAAIKWAGEYLEFRCPLDGEYKIGKSWKETH